MREISHDLDRLGSGSRFTVRAARDACARVCGVCGSERCGEGAAREVSAACEMEWSERVDERFREPPIEWPPSRVAPRSVLALLEISLLRDLAWAEDFSNLYPTLGSCPNTTLLKSIDVVFFPPSIFRSF